MIQQPLDIMLEDLDAQTVLAEELAVTTKQRKRALELTIDWAKSQPRTFSDATQLLDIAQQFADFLVDRIPTR